MAIFGKPAAIPRIVERTVQQQTGWWRLLGRDTGARPETAAGARETELDRGPREQLHARCGVWRRVNPAREASDDGRHGGDVSWWVGRCHADAAAAVV